MRILYIYRDYKGRRKLYGNMMEKCGHRVKYLRILEKRIKNQVRKEHIQKYKPDLIFIYTPYYITYKVISDEAINYIKSKNIPIALYATFDPEFPYPEQMDTWKKIDFLFVQHKGFSKFLKKEGLNAHYMPLAFHPSQYYKTISSSKKYNVSFMGGALRRVDPSKDKRAIFIQSLRKTKGLGVYGETLGKRLKGIKVYNYRGHDIQRKVYGKTKINLDLPFIDCKSKFYMNMYHFKNRFFEVPATENFLLCLKHPDFTEIFNEDMVGYYDNNVESLKESINKYLKDKKTRIKMAERAYKEVHQKHTFLHRFKKMFKIIDS